MTGRPVIGSLMIRAFEVFPLRGCQHDPILLDGNVERIAGANAELAAKRSGKNDLAFGGDPGLHGKTILPQNWIF